MCCVCVCVWGVEALTCPCAAAVALGEGASDTEDLCDVVATGVALPTMVRAARTRAWCRRSRAR